MTSRIPQLRFSIRPLCSIACGCLLFACVAARAQKPLVPESGIESLPAIAKKEKPSKKEKEKGKQGPQPAFSISSGPLGFAPPAAFYLGERFAQVSLDFLDEDSLLFTFRAPGLIAREHTPVDATEAERRIRALVLSLPDGKIVADSIWTQHDYSQYLWTIPGQGFLLRDRSMVQIGTRDLHLEPFLRFPGPVRALQLDSTRQFLVANSIEPAVSDAKPAPMPGSSSTQVSDSSTASASISTRDPSDTDASRQISQNLVRIFSMDTHKVLLYSHVNSPVRIPIDGNGYYESLRGQTSNWLIFYDLLRGGQTHVATVESACEPTLDSLHTGTVLATTCIGSGYSHITVLARDRDPKHASLWELSIPPTRVWPRLASSANGLRFARATLQVSHPVSAANPLDNSDIRSQIVDVYDLATGKLQLSVPVSPILDGGGNFALSPSGRRLAILSDGAIQVYDLPVPPDLPSPPAPKDTPAKP